MKMLGGAVPKSNARTFFILLAAPCLLVFSNSSFGQQTECGKCRKEAMLEARQCIKAASNEVVKDLCKKTAKGRIAACNRSICR